MGCTLEVSRTDEMKRVVHPICTLVIQREAANFSSGMKLLIEILRQY
jgi:hypothetical protein